MPVRRKLASMHFTSTAWFILCVGYVGVLALRQAGVRWWILFSLSGYGILIALVLISFYLFAIFRGISSSQKVKAEHPLTTTAQYSFFYVATPFLGALAGSLGMIGVEAFSRFLLGVALGTLVTTFFVWVIVDPVVGLLEMFLPASRKHYAERQAQAKAEREQKYKDNQRLLADIAAKEEASWHRWKEQLEPEAEKLAALLATDEIDIDRAEREAVGIGANAWRIGGLSCMRELRDMALALCKKKYHHRDVVDYIAFWWDGIGSWRSPCLRR